MQFTIHLKENNLRLLLEKDKSYLKESHKDKKYIVLFTNHRCGSNLLMSLLESVPGIENKNEALEHHQWLASRWTEKGVLDVDRMMFDVADSIDDRIPFYKVHFKSFRFLIPSATYRDFMTGGIPVFLTRNDILGQAISLVIAAQTKSWTSGQDEQAEPVYNKESISNVVSMLLEMNRGWHLFLPYNNIQPFHLSYETLCSKTDRVCHDLCEYMDISVDPDLSFSQDEVAIQRNERNERWRQRFLDELGGDWLRLVHGN